MSALLKVARRSLLIDNCDNARSFTHRLQFIDILFYHRLMRKPKNGFRNYCALRNSRNKLQKHTKNYSHLKEKQYFYKAKLNADVFLYIFWFLFFFEFQFQNALLDLFRDSNLDLVFCCWLAGEFLRKRQKSISLIN